MLAAGCVYWHILAKDVPWPFPHVRSAKKYTEEKAAFTIHYVAPFMWKDLFLSRDEA